MAKNPRKAKFYCENCGAEVPINAKFCRHCGRFFSSVRCPQCGTTGSPQKFASGCPVCGYAAGKERESEKNMKSLKKTGGAAMSRTEDSLPRWIYALILLVLAFVISLFLKIFR